MQKSPGPTVIIYLTQVWPHTICSVCPLKVNQVSIFPLVLQHDARLLVRYNEARCRLATQPLPLVRGQWTEKSFQVISCRYFNISFHSAAARPARPARAAYSGGWAAAAQNREAGALTASHTGGHTQATWGPGHTGRGARAPTHPSHPCWGPLQGRGRPGEAVMRLSTDLDPARPGSRHRVRPTLRQPAPAPTTTARPHQAHTVTPWTLALDWVLGTGIGGTVTSQDTG